MLNNRKGPELRPKEKLTFAAKFQGAGVSQGWDFCSNLRFSPRCSVEMIENIFSFLSDKMASKADLKLTDLPLLILARIAALTSEGTPSDVANFAFQVICAPENLRLLQPLRECCRYLREAAHLAVGGIYTNYNDGDGINFRTPDNEALPARGITMRPDCLRSLPCLREFEIWADILPHNIAQVIKKVPNLKRIKLSGETEEESWKLGPFCSCHTVEELNFCSFHSADPLLAFPLPQLRSLELMMMPNVPWVPAQASSALRRVVWHGDLVDYDLGKLLRSLLDAPKVHCLILEECSLEGMLELKAGDRFQALQTLGFYLSYDITYDEGEVQLSDYSHYLAPALRRGCFPALRNLEVSIRSPGLHRNAPRLKELEPVFRACAANLEKLEVWTQNFMFTEDDVAMLRGLEWSQHLDVRVSMQDKRIAGSRYGEVYTMSNIAKLPFLTTLSLRFVSICNIEELFTQPRLKRVSFDTCRFEASEAEELVEKWTSPDTLVFESCEPFTEEGETIFFEQNPNSYPFLPLTVEHRGY